MKFRKPNLAWGVVVGIPLILICVIGMFAALIGWHWLDDKSAAWYDHIYDGSLQ